MRGGDFGLGPAHHAPQADRPLGVGNHAHAGLERVGFVVDGQERFALAGLADDDSSALQTGQVEGVQRLAALHQHIVRDVDDVVDRRDADRRQAIDQPGRARAELSRRESPGRCSGSKASGQSSVDARSDRSPAVAAFARIGRRQLQRPIPKHRDFAGDAEVAQAVGPIAGHFQIDRPIVAVLLGRLRDSGRPSSAGRSTARATCRAGRIVSANPRKRASVGLNWRTINSWRMQT